MVVTRDLLTYWEHGRDPFHTIPLKLANIICIDFVYFLISDALRYVLEGLFLQNFPGAAPPAKARSAALRAASLEADYMDPHLLLAVYGPETDPKKASKMVPKSPQKFLKSKVKKNSRKVKSQNFTFIYTYVIGYSG